MAGTGRKRPADGGPLDPHYACGHLVAGFIYEEMGAYDVAIHAHRTAVALSEKGLFYLAGLGRALAVAGKPEEARKIFRELEESWPRTYVSPYFVARLLAALGEDDQAFEWLERAYVERDFWLLYIKALPGLEKLRGDPRFQDLLRRMNFPEQ